MPDTYQTKVYFEQGGDKIVVKSGGVVHIEEGGQLDNAGAVAGAAITVGAEAGNARAITVQLLDAQGNDLTQRQAVHIAVFADANGDAYATTGGSTGIAIGADGALLPIVAKKLFHAISEADGDIDLTWTDTGTEVAYLGVILPSGKIVISDALTNA